MCSSSLYSSESFTGVNYANMSYLYQQTLPLHRNISPYKKVVDAEVLSNKVRVLQDNLVFVSGLPADMASVQTLSSELFFGRYGPVQKVILNKINQNKKNSSYQAYVTYWNSVDASLAIVALDGFSFKGKALKVSYGTTKYCAYFLKGYDCPNLECFYLHKHDPSRQMSSNDSKQIFKKQIAVAIDIVEKNLIEIVGKSLQSQGGNVLQGFPSINEVIEYLIEKKMIAQQQVDYSMKYLRGENVESYEIEKSFESYENKKLECFEKGNFTNETGSSENGLQPLNKVNNMNIIESQFYSLIEGEEAYNNYKKEAKLTKSNSFSTLNSPKNEEQSADKKKQFEDCAFQSFSYMNPEDQIPKGRKHSSFSSSTQDIERTILDFQIEDMILKNFEQKTSKSKFRFAQAKSFTLSKVSDRNKISDIVKSSLSRFPE